jgi:cytochrome P450
MSKVVAEASHAITSPGVRWAPGPRGLGLLRAMRLMARDPLRLYSTMRAEYGDVVGTKLGPLYVCMAFGADGVGHVLQERHAIYHKDNVDYRLVKPVLGNGLATSNGDFWLRQRRLMQPAFHHRRVAAFASVMTSRAVAMLDGWEEAAKRREPLDVAAEMMRLTLEIVTSVLFGVDVSGSIEVIRESFTTVNRRVGDMFGKPWMMLPGMHALPTPGNRRAWAAQRRLDAVVRAIIAERRGNGESSDLISMLLHARDETGTGMSDRQLRDEVMTMLLAGHETTSNALAWTFYLLSRHPDAADRLRAELRRALGGRVPTIDDLAHLPYARMVIEESLRLYPPVWTLSRTPREDDVIGGYHIPAGALVIISPWVTHRHPDLWEEPERFDPERFTPARVAARPRFAYIPFAAGPRLCIGEAFAMQEAHLVLATVAQRFRLDLVSPDAVEPEPLVTLRPRGGLPMTLTPL